MKCYFPIPGQSCALQMAISSEFPTHGLPTPAGKGFEHVLCLLFSPPLQDWEHAVHADHDDQAPFTGTETLE